MYLKPTGVSWSSILCFSASALIRLVVATDLPTPFFQPRRFHQIVKQQRDDVVGLEERAVVVDNPEAVGIAIGRNANPRADFAHLVPQVFEQMIVGFGRVASKEHIASVMDGGHRYASLAQERVRIAAGSAPHGIEGNLDAGFLDDVEIDDLAQPRKIHAARIDRLR